VPVVKLLRRVEKILVEVVVGLGSSMSDKFLRWKRIWMYFVMCCVDPRQLCADVHSRIFERRGRIAVEFLECKEIQNSSDIGQDVLTEGFIEWKGFETRQSFGWNDEGSATDSSTWVPIEREGVTWKDCMGEKSEGEKSCSNHACTLHTIPPRTGEGRGKDGFMSATNDQLYKWQSGRFGIPSSIVVMRIAITARIMRR
jgi:hypothetical protein